MCLVCILGVKPHSKLLCNGIKKSSGAVCKNQVASLVTVAGKFGDFFVQS